MVAHFTMRTHGVNQAFRFVKGILLYQKSRQIRFFFGKRPCFHLSCATWNEQPSNMKTMGEVFCSSHSGWLTREVKETTDLNSNDVGFETYFFTVCRRSIVHLHKRGKPLLLLCTEYTMTIGQDQLVIWYILVCYVPFITLRKITNSYISSYLY